MARRGCHAESQRGCQAKKQGNHSGIQRTVQTVLPDEEGGIPILFEVCPLGASGPSKLTSQFRFWSLLLIHVESLPNLGQRRSGNVRRQNVSPSRSGSWESLCRG